MRARAEWRGLGGKGGVDKRTRSPSNGEGATMSVNCLDLAASLFDEPARTIITRAAMLRDIMVE